MADEEMDQVWEAQAQWWQDTFTDGADVEYEEQILPIAAEHLQDVSRVLDLGTGEGQLARLATKCGAELVVGLDRSRAQIEVAVERGQAHFARADARRLPVPGSAFDAVTASLVLEHIDDVEEVLNEVGRVLRPGGRFLLLINHPLLQTPGSGWIDDQILMEQYWRIGPYLKVDRTMEEVEPGVVIPFVHRPLSHYVNAMAAAGLFVTAMVEPAPPPGFLAQAEEYADAASYPRLLFVRAEKLSRAKPRS